MDASPKPVRHSALMAGVSPAEVFAVVVDFPAYPRLFPEIKQVRVLSNEAGRVRAEFRGNLVLPFRYVLDLDCDAQTGTVKWIYVEGEMVKDSTGGWRFAAESAGTRVEYQVSLRIEAPVPGFLLRKITDGLLTLSLPAMFASLEREVGRRRG
jgi:ribosome-associated toxin RatA of RatAB toxin-antitoxin module